MRSSRGERNRDVERLKTQLRAEVANYEDAVTLISSIEQWIMHLWGEKGEIAQTLQQFNRFPECGDLRPDFLASFDTGYRLCGEVMKTFRRSDVSSKDAEQLVAYACYLAETEHRDGPGDVVALVHPHTVEDATSETASGLRARREQGRDPRPVVVLSYYPDRGINGEWYDLKWWNLNENSRFSELNVVEEGSELDGLNQVIIQPGHRAIPIDLMALDVSMRNPLINDRPPPLYTAVTVVYPALLTELTTGEQRDLLQTDKSATARFTRDRLMQTDCLSSIGPPVAYVQDALDFMVEHKLVRQIPRDDGPEYEIALDPRRLARDLSDMLGERAARYRVGRAVERQRARRRRAARAQMKLSFSE